MSPKAEKPANQIQLFLYGKKKNSALYRIAEKDGN